MARYRVELGDISDSTMAFSTQVEDMSLRITLFWDDDVDDRIAEVELLIKQRAGALSVAQLDINDIHKVDDYGEYISQLDKWENDYRYYIRDYREPFIEAVDGLRTLTQQFLTDMQASLQSLADNASMLYIDINHSRHLRDVRDGILAVVATLATATPTNLIPTANAINAISVSVDSLLDYIDTRSQWYLDMETYHAELNSMRYWHYRVERDETDIRTGRLCPGGTGFTGDEWFSLFVESEKEYLEKGDLKYVSLVFDTEGEVA